MNPTASYILAGLVVFAFLFVAIFRRFRNKKGPIARDENIATQEGKEGRMNERQHLERHQLLHKHLDELFADYIRHQEGSHGEFVKRPIMELMQWSNAQAGNPGYPGRLETDLS